MAKYQGRFVAESSRPGKGKKSRFGLPVWLIMLFSVLFFELLLHFWVTANLNWGRLVAIIAFALGLGSVLGLLLSFLPAKGWRKWVTVAVLAVLGVIYLVEYFLYDAYKTFMTLESVINGAGGVATGYFETVMNLLVKNFWRIALMLLPAILLACLGRPQKVRWSLRGLLAAVAAAMYVLAFTAVYGLTNDSAQMGVAGSFDASIRAFGLNVALGLEVTRDSAGGQELEFEPVPTMPTKPTEPTEPTQVTEPDPDSTDSTDSSESTEPTETEPIVYGPNVLPIDFAALAEAEGDATIASLHNYVASQTPTMQNEYTGLFEGKNLIFITAEAFSAPVVSQELTPTLYRLIHEGIYFEDYYQPVWGGGTTTGEFTNLVGLYPAIGVGVMDEAVQQDLFFTIGNLLQEEGYFSRAYHNNDHTYYSRHLTHTHLGYDEFIGYGNGMEEGITKLWPESDLEMMQFTLDQYIDNQPFSVYYMTVSGHSTYGLNNDMSEKNYDAVKDLDYSLAVKCYLACNLELEYAMSYLIEQLEAAGIADDTVIVLGTDHYPYGLAASDTWGSGQDYLYELYGGDASTGFTRDKTPLIIWSGCLEDKDIVVEDPVFSLDILPTLCNLFGLEYDSRLLVGRDVFSDAEPLVFFIDNSWKTDKGQYDATTGKFTPAEGVEVEEGYVEYINAIMSNKIAYSRKTQWYNYFNYLSPIVEELNTQP